MHSLILFLLHFCTVLYTIFNITIIIIVFKEGTITPSSLNSISINTQKASSINSLYKLPGDYCDTYTGLLLEHSNERVACSRNSNHLQIYKINSSDYIRVTYRISFYKYLKDFRLRCRVSVSDAHQD